VPRLNTTRSSRALKNAWSPQRVGLGHAVDLEAARDEGGQRDLVRRTTFVAGSAPLVTVTVY
jgi:hypothetical protein